MVCCAGAYVDLQGSEVDWALPKRSEDLVLVVCGRQGRLPTQELHYRTA